MMATTQKVAMIIGNPVKQSLGPIVYKNVFQKLGLEDKYMYDKRELKTSELGSFVDEVRTKNIRGVSITIPHKETIMQYLNNIDETAKAIGAVNTLVNDNGKISGYNTDWIGVIRPLQKVTELHAKNVAIVGAGGAARAIAYGIKKAGGNFVVYNRSLERAKKIAEDLGGQAQPLDKIAEIASADIIINATPIGHAPMEDQSPISKNHIKQSQIVFDIISHPYNTQLILDAESKGAKVLHGVEMWSYQGAQQLKLFFNIDVDPAVLRDELKAAQEKYRG